MNDTSTHPCFSFLSSSPPFITHINPITNDLTCHVKYDINPKTELFSLDLKYILSYNILLTSSFSQTFISIIQHMGIKVFKEVIFWLNMIVLLNTKSIDNEREEFKYYRIYLHSLNKIPPNLSSWSNELQNQLKGCSLYKTLDEQYNSQQVPGSKSIIKEILYLLDMIRSYYSNHKDKFNNLCPIALQLLLASSNESIFTNESIAWSRGHYLSRRFSHPTFYSKDKDIIKTQITSELIGYGNNIGVFIPILDLFNHSTSSSSCTIEYKESVTNNPYIIISTGDSILKAGDEITFNYGSLSNEKLLHAYGFCIKDNIYDEVCFSLKTSEQSFECYIKNGGISMIPKSMWQFLSGIEDINEVEIGYNEVSMLYYFISQKLEQLNTNTLQSIETCIDDSRLEYIKIFISSQKSIYSELLNDLSEMLEDFDENE